MTWNFRTSACSSWLPLVLPLVLLLVVPLTAAASPGDGAGPPFPDRPAADGPLANPPAAHPAGAAGAAAADASAAELSFAEAVRLTAAAPPVEGVRSHAQGEFLPAEQTDPNPPPDDGEQLLQPTAPHGPAAPDQLQPAAPGDLAAQFNGLGYTGWIPPDTILAVGPDDVVEAVNSGFAVYDKSGGTEQGYTTFDFFFAPLLPVGWQGFLFDPRVVYAPEHSRYVLLALGLDTVNQESYFFLAVSQSTDPTGGWWGYRWANTAGNAADADAWLDYCGLGADTWGLYVTCNMFSWTNNFKHAKLYSLGPAHFSGGAGTGWMFWDLRWNSNAQAASLQPAAPYSVAGDQATFFVNTFSFSGSSMLLWELTGDRTDNPTLVRSTIGVATYNAIGNNVDQPGSSSDIDGGDARVMNAAYHQRKVYAVLTDDVDNDGSHSGWLTVKLDVDSNSRDWQHLLWTGTGFYYIYPAVTLRGADLTSAPELAVFGSWTDTETTINGATQFASGLFKIYTDQPAGADGPFISFASGGGPYVLFTGGRNRWGDYSGAAYDWSLDLAWGGVEIATSNNRWQTVIRGMEIGAGCVPDGFEPDGASGQASGIVSGVTQGHNICPAGDEDWVSFSVAGSSEITLETSGAAGDTRMWLYDSALNELEFDDDDGTNLFSFIDRTCGNDALPAGTYYVKVDEFADDDEIAAYDLSYVQVQGCGGCATDLVLANDTLTGTQSFHAQNSITLGPDLVVDGTSISMLAGQRVVIGNGTRIGGTFSAGTSVSPCP